MSVEECIKESIITKEKMLEDISIIKNIKEASNAIIRAYKNGNKVMTAGNGGSTADAQHIAGELVGRFQKDRRALDAIALTNDMFVMTAVSNDFGFDRVFARQIQAHGKKGDIFIGISTSGNSENIISALSEARLLGVVTIGLTGKNKCKMDEMCDYIIKVPSDRTPVIQECHVMIGHIICGIVENELFAD